MNLSGVWRGHYTYDEHATLTRLPAHPIAFEMTLRQKWFGMVAGTVQDDPKDGFPDLGKIRGSFKNGTFSFRKLMPTLRMVHEGSQATLEEWAQRRNIATSDFPVAHPPILFRGKLSEDGQTLEGVFSLAEMTIEVPGYYRGLPIPLITGTWTAKRA